MRSRIRDAIPNRLNRDDDPRGRFEDVASVCRLENDERDASPDQLTPDTALAICTPRTAAIAVPPKRKYSEAARAAMAPTVRKIPHPGGVCRARQSCRPLEGSKAAISDC